MGNFKAQCGANIEAIEALGFEVIPVGKKDDTGAPSSYEVLTPYIKRTTRSGEQIPLTIRCSFSGWVRYYSPWVLGGHNYTLLVRGIPSHFKDPNIKWRSPTLVTRWEGLEYSTKRCLEYLKRYIAKHDKQVA